MNKLADLFKRYKAIFSDFSDIDFRDVNQKGMGDDTLLHCACSHSSLDDVKLLVQSGANVNAKGDLGLTPLHLAASKGRCDIVKFLLEAGADKAIGNDYNELPIDWAKNNNQEEAVQLLQGL